MTTTVQLRLDKKTKESARKVFENMGLDLSSGIKLFLTRVVQDQAIPFIIRTKNGYTEEFEQQLLRDLAQAKQTGKSFNTVKKLLAELS